MVKDCIFCKIVKGESPASVEMETENVISFKSIDPVAATHILIVPKKHLADVMSFGENDGDLLLEMMKIAQDLIKNNNIEDGYKLVFNGGRYQAIPHVHWHLLGGEMK